MKKLIHIIETTSDVASGHFTGWLVILVMILVMVEVVSRYAFHRALGVADELGAYMLVAIAFVGLAYVAKRREHIRIILVVSRLRPKVRKWLRLLTLLISLVFYSLLTKACYHLITYSISQNARSTSWLRIPVAEPQMFMIVGSALICLQLIADIIYAVRDLRAGEEAHDP